MTIFEYVLHIVIPISRYATSIGKRYIGHCVWCYLHQIDVQDLFLNLISISFCLVKARFKGQ